MESIEWPVFGFPEWIRPVVYLVGGLAVGGAINVVLLMATWSRLREQDRDVNRLRDRLSYLEREFWDRN